MLYFKNSSVDWHVQILECLTLHFQILFAPQELCSSPSTTRGESQQKDSKMLEQHLDK